MNRLLVLTFGLCSYVVFFGTFLYAIGFTGGVVVPKDVNAGPAGSLVQAVVIDVLLLGLFALQHSIMARHSFKRRWTRFVPPPIERSAFVLLSSLVLLLLFWQWRPLASVVWDVGGAGAVALRAIFWLGWGLVFVATFQINHFDLFGLRQAYRHYAGRPYQPVPFVQPLLYRFVRHPIMLGFLLAFWATPRMTAGHLLFSCATTGYILVGILLEERDLLAAHGEAYEAYRRQVSMLVPVPRRPRRERTEA
jgi:protein-S-isoprenylcysteine O-methyltransferase Ste14